MGRDGEAAPRPSGALMYSTGSYHVEASAHPQKADAGGEAVRRRQKAPQMEVRYRLSVHPEAMAEPPWDARGGNGAEICRAA